MSGTLPSVDDAATAAGLTPPTAEEKAGTVGAQVIFDLDGAAALGARGTYRVLRSNRLLRDQGIIQMGLDPLNVTGGWRDQPDRPLPTEPPAEEPA